MVFNTLIKQVSFFNSYFPPEFFVYQSLCASELLKACIWFTG